MSIHRTAAPPRPHATTHRPARRAALAGLALATAALLVGCSSGGSDAADPGSTTTTAADTSTTVATGEAPVATTQPSDGAGTDAGGGTESGGGNGGTESGGGNAPTTPVPTGAKPVITSFTTPESIDCHNGDFQEFSASWTTTGATKTMISIDGPGGYRTYGPNGSDSLPFNCSSAHTFLLTATSADGQTATRSITLQPRNVQAPESPEDTEPTEGEG